MPKKFDDYTQSERVTMMQEDLTKYLDLVPTERWEALLDGVAKVSGDEQATARRRAWQKLYYRARTLPQGEELE